MKFHLFFFQTLRVFVLLTSMLIPKASFVGMLGMTAPNRLVCCELCGAMITWKKLSEASSSCEAFCLNASSMQVGFFLLFFVEEKQSPLMIRRWKMCLFYPR